MGRLGNAGPLYLGILEQRRRFRLVRHQMNRILSSQVKVQMRVIDMLLDALARQIGVNSSLWRDFRNESRAFKAWNNVLPVLDQSLGTVFLEIRRKRRSVHEAVAAGSEQMLGPTGLGDWIVVESKGRAIVKDSVGIRRGRRLKEHDYIVAVFLLRLESFPNKVRVTSLLVPRVDAEARGEFAIRNRRHERKRVVGGSHGARFIHDQALGRAAGIRRWRAAEAGDVNLDEGGKHVRFGEAAKPAVGGWLQVV